MSNSALSAWLRLAFAPGLSLLKKHQLLAPFGTAECLLDNLHRLSIEPELKKDLQQGALESVNQALQWQQQPPHQIIPLDSSDYPPLLRQTSTPPFVLFAKGDITLLSQPQIAIVGSRKATPIGCSNARQLASDLAEQGITVTSGLAHGIDGSAHRGALCHGASTVAVLGCGLNRIYPKAHLALAQRIIEQGLLVSEFPLDCAPLAFNFPQRNRIISGLCLGTVVIEAQSHSGSLITAKLALEQNRQVFAMPGAIANPQTAGTHQLIKQGAILVTDFKDIIDEISAQLPASGAPSGPGNKRQHCNEKLDQKHINLLEYIDFAPTSVTEIGRSSGMQVADINSILSILELNSYIVKVPGGYFRVR